MRIEFTVNGTPRAIEAAPLRRLLDILRDDLGLTGTKEGCGEGECGACAVLIDGELVNACLVPAVQLPGRSVLTIEGLGSREHPDRVQEAFLEEGAVQCGFCIPGMVMASHALLEKHQRPTREQIRTGLAGNLCRCTGYERIVRAVERAAGMPPSAPAAASPPASSPASSLAAAPAPSGAPHDSCLGDLLRGAVPDAGTPTPIAGGTDVMTGLQLGAEPPHRVLDLSTYPELQEITLREASAGPGGGDLEIGAAVTVSRLLEDPLVARHAPALQQAADLFGAPAIRNRATLGGNLMSASPAADLPPVLLALDAIAVFTGTEGEREVPLDRFYLGYRRTAGRDGEILTRLRIPLPAPPVPASLASIPASPSPQHRQAFYKVGTRRAQSIAKVSLAGRLELCDDGTILLARLAAGSVAATPILLRETAAWLEGQRLSHRARMPGPGGRDENPLFAEAERRAAAEVQPIDDVRSTAAYRRAVTGRLVRRFLEDQSPPP